MDMSNSYIIILNLPLGPNLELFPPYTLLSYDSDEVQSWITTQSISASNFDRNNLNALVKTIPEYIREDSSNKPYDLFISMMGQHFDNVYFYTKDVTNRFNGDNRLNFGLSKDLVAQALKDFGIKIYQNNFSSDDLYASYLGYNADGSILTPTGSEVIYNYITASNENIPFNDLSKEVYKRLFHNLPYLLKKKGTIEGLRGLISCYGIPDTILRLVEFGGKDKIDAQDWDFFYRKYSKAVSTAGSWG